MSSFDIDRLGMLTLQHFENQVESDSSWGESCSHSNSELSSNASSPPYSCEEFESPASSPSELKSPLPDGRDKFLEPNANEEVVDGSEEMEEGNWSEKRACRYRRGRRGKETISKRNERERRRVRLISDGFVSLRQRVMMQPSSRKLPKLQILRKAILYIKNLQEMIKESDAQNGSVSNQPCFRRSTAPPIQMAYLCDSSFMNEQVQNMQTYYVDTPTLQKHEADSYQQVRPQREKPWLQRYTL